MLNVNDVYIFTEFFDRFSSLEKWNSQFFVFPQLDASQQILFVASRRIAYGEELGTLPAISNRYPYFYRDGYNFLGWFTEKEGGSQVYATTLRTEGMDTLYAHWSPIAFNISYNDYIVILF